MVQLIRGSYDGNSAVGAGLTKLGEAIWGDQAKNEVDRQKAFGLKRNNDAAIPLADALARGDKNEAIRQSSLADRSAGDASGYSLLSRSNHATGLDDPALALAQIGAGGSAGNTFAGQGRSLANDRSIAGGHDATSRANNADTNSTTLKANDMTTARQRETQLAIDERTLTPVDDGNGGLVYRKKSEASGLGAPSSTDQVVANMLRKQATLAQPQPGAPAADPFANVDPRILHKAGLGLPDQSMVNPATGLTGISRDGGRTVILPNGGTASATGYQPVDQGTALAEARGGIQRAATSQPLVVGDPTKSQAAADAAQTSGLGAKFQKVTNEEIGALPGGSSVIKAVSGSPEIAPATQRAQSQQDVRNNSARAVLLGGPGRQTVQAQKWINDLIPQGDAFANPATEAAKIPTIVNALKGDHEQYRQIVQTTSDPKEREKAVLAMHQIENTIRMYTEPQQAAPAAPPQAAAAPAAPQGGGDPLSQARAAIAAGAPRAAVLQRLQQNGIPAEGL